MNDEDYVGKKHGRLTVLEVLYIYQKNRKRKFFKCICDCGKIHITRADGILNKKTFSCGCQKNEKNKGKNYKHFSYGTRLYNIYAGMKQRCYNPNCHCFKRYGKRGIKICSQWLNDFVSLAPVNDDNTYTGNPFCVYRCVRVGYNHHFAPFSSTFCDFFTKSVLNAQVFCLSQYFALYSARHFAISKGVFIRSMQVIGSRGISLYTYSVCVQEAKKSAVAMIKISFIARAPLNATTTNQHTFYGGLPPL
jgi:hypothetical protein